MLDDDVSIEINRKQRPIYTLATVFRCITVIQKQDAHVRSAWSLLPDVRRSSPRWWHLKWTEIMAWHISAREARSLTEERTEERFVNGFVVFIIWNDTCNVLCTGTLCCANANGRVVAVVLRWSSWGWRLALFDVVGRYINYIIRLPCRRSGELKDLCLWVLCLHGRICVFKFSFFNVEYYRAALYANYSMRIV